MKIAGGPWGTPTVVGASFELVSRVGIATATGPQFAICSQNSLRSRGTLSLQSVEDLIVGWLLFVFTGRPMPGI